MQAGTPTHLSAELVERLRARGGRWLVTGAAGFIGSNLVEALLTAGVEVVGLDSFVTGHRANLEDVRRCVGDERWARFHFIESDIRDRSACTSAVEGVDHVLHQAALGSVPRSMSDPLTSYDVNVTGFVNLLDASRRSGVRRFVYAASSSSYGDSEALPKREDQIGSPLSPYAATKLADEIFAEVFARSFSFGSIGLRYFNVFGQRQDPNGPYAAVIPRWIDAMIRGDDVVIYGDGTTSRDFCYVANAVQANMLAALVDESSGHEIYNVAVGRRTSLLELFGLLRSALADHGIDYRRGPVVADFRPGDIRHSEADIGKARRGLGYEPTHEIGDGIREAVAWYVRNRGGGTNA